jgi:hypothetical protein
MNVRMLTFNDADFNRCWNQGIAEIKAAHPFYSAIVREYDHIYLGQDFVSDDSFILLDDRGAVLALVPLYLCSVEDKPVYGYGNTHQVAPIVAGAETLKQHQEVLLRCHQHIEELATKKNVVRHRTYFTNPTVPDGIYWNNPLKHFGYQDESCTGLLLPLCEEEKTLWSNIRKSYRPLINKAERQYRYLVIDKSNFDFVTCEEYRRLHYAAAGRATRPAESFHQQYALIQNDQGYLIFVMREAEYVGAYFFYRLKECVYYASAATLPEIDAQSGVGHLGLWKGIQKAKEIGARYMDFGMLFLEHADPKVSNIEFFKFGFGGRRVMMFRGTRHFLTQ